MLNVKYKMWPCMLTTQDNSAQLAVYYLHSTAAARCHHRVSPSLDHYNLNLAKLTLNHQHKTLPQTTQLWIQRNKHNYSNCHV